MEDQATLDIEQKMEEERRVMFNAAMNGNWEAVKNEFLKDPSSREAKITSSEDTVLHFAVIEGHRAVVKDLVNLLHGNAEKEKILLARNKRGNTPLHLAAAQGDAKLCRFLATLSEKPNVVVSEALEARNQDGETPLFLAALHGKKDAFFLLLDKKTKPITDYFSRNDGNTILHVALLGDHFDLAFQIIHVFKKEEQGKNVAINRHNEKGQSALHILAKSSHAFRSRYYPGTIEQIIYYLTWADSLEVEKSIRSNDIQYSTQSAYHEKKRLFPENYSTCAGMVKLALKPFQANGNQCNGWNTNDAENPPATTKMKKSPSISLAYARALIPPNYVPQFQFVETAIMFTLTLLGFGFWDMEIMKLRKQRHIWAVQVMKELVEGSSSWEYLANSKRPDLSIPPSRLHESSSGTDPANTTDTNKTETEILIAAKHGVVEIVKKILEVFPAAIQDETKDGKSVVLLAAEHRQPFVYQLLWKKFMKVSAFQKADNDGNSALHLAAKGGKGQWNVPGAAFQLLGEIKWCKSSVDPHFFRRLNNEGQTAKKIFTESHRELEVEGGKWLTKTSESCSVVAALIASVAFAAAVTVPDGVKEDIGTPNLEGKPAFDLFAISSLTALCLSVTSLVTFLSILISGHVTRDFERSLPKKLMIGLTSLFFSIAAILLSFCSGHYFILRNRLKHVAFTMYAVSCVPITIFAFLYLNLLRATLARFPPLKNKKNA